MAMGPLMSPAPLLNIDPSHGAARLGGGGLSAGPSPTEAKAQPVEGFAGAGELYAMEVRGWRHNCEHTEPCPVEVDWAW